MFDRHAFVLDLLPSLGKGTLNFSSGNFLTRMKQLQRSFVKHSYSVMNNSAHRLILHHSLSDHGTLAQIDWRTPTLKYTCQIRNTKHSVNCFCFQLFLKLSALIVDFLCPRQYRCSVLPRKENGSSTVAHNLAKPCRTDHSSSRGDENEAYEHKRFGSESHHCRSTYAPDSHSLAAASFWKQCMVLIH